MPFVRTFSRHFVEMYVGWRGCFPDIEEVNRLVDTAQQLRPQMMLYKLQPDGTYKEYLLLAEFWNHEAGAVIRLDEREGTAVTIIAAGRRKEFRRGKKWRERCPK